MQAGPRAGDVRWALAGTAVLLAGTAVVVRADIAQRREAFQTDARIAHRLLSQRALQHEAILDTLVLLGPALAATADRPEQRLPALQPQVLAVLRRDRGTAWGDAALQAAEARSLASRRAELATLDAAAGRYTVLRSGDAASYALVVDAQRLVPWDEWPIARNGPVRVQLQSGAQSLVLQPGASPDAQPLGLTAGFVAAKPLAAPSQPFVLHLSRATGPAQWPWGLLAAWAAACIAGTLLLRAVARARQSRRRAEELLRVGQVARLNALGELAAGMAHELNQPLTALVAGTQAARRLIDDDPPDLQAARQAMSLATTQARRAADVVARLRRLVAAPGAAAALQAVRVEALARRVADLQGPDAQRAGATLQVEGQCPPVLADPVALEQIVHNLVGNALQALARAPAGPRRVLLQVSAQAGLGVLTVRDTGPGIAAEALPRLFEPFYTTRPDGLGLGLSLCETLAQQMHGSIAACNAEGGGAEFRLSLPLAAAPPRTEPGPR